MPGASSSSSPAGRAPALVAVIGRPGRSKRTFVNWSAKDYLFPPKTEKSTPPRVTLLGRRGKDILGSFDDVFLEAEAGAEVGSEKVDSAGTASISASHQSTAPNFSGVLTATGLSQGFAPAKKRRQHAVHFSCSDCIILDERSAGGAAGLAAEHQENLVYALIDLPTRKNVLESEWLPPTVNAVGPIADDLSSLTGLLSSGLKQTLDLTRKGLATADRVKGMIGMGGAGGAGGSATDAPQHLPGAMQPGEDIPLPASVLSEQDRETAWQQCFESVVQAACVVLIFVEGADDCARIAEQLKQALGRDKKPVHWFQPKWDLKAPAQRESERGAIRGKLTGVIVRPVGFESDPHDFMFDSLPEPEVLQFNGKPIPMVWRNGGEAPTSTSTNSTAQQTRRYSMALCHDAALSACTDELQRMPENAATPKLKNRQLRIADLRAQRRKEAEAKAGGEDKRGAAPQTMKTGDSKGASGKGEQSSENAAENKDSEATADVPKDFAYFLVKRNLLRVLIMIVVVGAFAVGLHLWKQQRRQAARRKAAGRGGGGYNQHSQGAGGAGGRSDHDEF